MINFTRLTDEQLVSIAKSKNGHSREAKTQLFERYKKFLERRANGYFLKHCEPGDFVSETYYSFLKAIDDFQEGRNQTFNNFLDQVVYRRMCTFIKGGLYFKIKSFDVSPRLDQPLTQDAPGLSLHDVIRGDNDDEILERRIYQDRIRQLEKQLTDIERQCVRYYLRGYTYDEIGSLISVPRKCVDNAIERAKHKAQRFTADQI
jgi:RNA polymerase sporulation-specific sigma factor